MSFVFGPTELLILATGALLIIGILVTYVLRQARIG